MPTLNYDLSKQAELAFTEAVDDVAPYLIDHYHRGLEMSGIIMTHHIIKGGQRVAVVTDTAKNFTIIWLKKEIDEKVDELNRPTVKEAQLNQSDVEYQLSIEAKLNINEPLSEEEQKWYADMIHRGKEQFLRNLQMVGPLKEGERVIMRGGWVIKLSKEDPEAGKE